MMPCRETVERLEVLPVAGFGNGSIARGSAVALFDPLGRYLGDGTMGGTRGDGIGVDVDRIAAVEVAYVVAVSPDGEEMRVFVNRERLSA